ncbi:hypothetical protein [Desulfogranum mediterraneum]|uniref:hypothetical protein n=1 Tax=Desulfogranum mediterraneum TaxID=160661 RepID=UPI00040B6C43|nr:hypothetical protein [Desulfogranum mediterraneum]
MSQSTLPAFVQALCRAGIYPHPVNPDQEVGLVQTHISYVFLAGDFVYKFKKPVNFGFLDFSDLEKRRRCCEQELLLNRRLCPEIYLELVTLTLDAGDYQLNGKGEIVEYGIKMVRMPEEAMMVNLIKAGALERRHLDQLVETLVPFYQAAAGGAELAEFGTAAAVGVNVLENFEQTRSFIGKGALEQEQFDTIVRYSQAVLADEDRFQERISGGYIRDCHGDLYSANICLANQVYVYDCIEFNDRFRYGDVASDIGFLAMDLDYHGLAELSRYLVRRFSEASGDAGLAGMIPFYQCYRAYVRGKIGLFTAADPAVDESVRSDCLKSAARYFKLAQGYAEA